MVSSTKTSNSRQTSSSVHTIVFFFCVFDAIDAIVNKLRDCTHAQNHGKARQAHMKRMAGMEDVFTQQKSLQTRFFFFFRFWGHWRLWPQNQEKVSPDPLYANMVQKVYTVKISGPYQLSLGPDPFFFL